MMANLIHHGTGFRYCDSIFVTMTLYLSIGSSSENARYGGGHGGAQTRASQQADQDQDRRGVEVTHLLLLGWQATPSSS